MPIFASTRPREKKKQAGQCIRNVTCLCNHCCNGNVTMCSLCIVELHVTANNRKIFNVAQQHFYGNFILLATMKCTGVRM
jgi:hypothetical protein